MALGKGLRGRAPPDPTINPHCCSRVSVGWRGGALRAAPPAGSSAGASPATPLLPAPSTAPAQTGQRCLRTPVLMAAVGRRAGGTPSFLGPAPCRATAGTVLPGRGSVRLPGPSSAPRAPAGAAGPGLVRRLLHSLLGVGRGRAEAGQPGGSVLARGGGVLQEPRESELQQQDGGHDEPGAEQQQQPDREGACGGERGEDGRRGPWPPCTCRGSPAPGQGASAGKPPRVGPQHLRRPGSRCSLQRLSTATLSRAASFPASSSRPRRLSGTKATSVTTMPCASFT